MRTIVAATLLVCLTASAYGTLRETYNVIKTKHWDDSISYDVMTDREVKAFQKGVTTETRLGTKALRLAQQQWGEHATYGAKTFPRKVTTPARTSKVGNYREQEKATAKCDALKARQDETAARDKKACTNRKKGRSKEANAREAAKLAARDKFYATARSTYEAALETVAAPPAPRTE